VPKTIVVTLLNATTDGSSPPNGAPTPLRTWTLYAAWPTKWAISELESQRNDVVIETLEFAYDHFTVR
jgi:phage tail-like protein